MFRTRKQLEVSKAAAVATDDAVDDAVDEAAHENGATDEAVRMENIDVEESDEDSLGPPIPSSSSDEELSDAGEDEESDDESHDAESDDDEADGSSAADDTPDPPARKLFRYWNRLFVKTPSINRPSIY